jgi:hypothetical protein
MNLLAWILFPYLATFSFDQQMNREDQIETGVSQLSSAQKSSLEEWIDSLCTCDSSSTQTTPTPTDPSSLSLSQNIHNGRQLRLSDGSLYEVAPVDVNSSALWITPFSIKIERSSDPNYPYLLINLTSGTAVKAKQLEPPSR